MYAPAQQVIRQVVLEEDAYTQPRALLDQLEVDAGEAWIADRNFCVRDFLFRLHRAQGVFVILWHAQCPYQEMEPLHRANRTAHGAMEHQVWLQDPATQEWLRVRRIVLSLAQPTRSGDTELILLTDLPDTVDADELCNVYRDRWQIELHYQQLTQQLHCEQPGLTYPRAALFTFAMAATAGNALAVVQKALQARHGEEAVRELSYYALVLEISRIWLGMAIVMPPKKWQFVRYCGIEELVTWFGYVAQFVRMDRCRKSACGAERSPLRQLRHCRADQPGGQ